MTDAARDWRDDLERWANCQPGKIALIMAESGESWDFETLNREADAACAWFLSLGLSEGATIAMVIENRREMIVLW